MKGVLDGRKDHLNVGSGDEDYPEEVLIISRTENIIVHPNPIQTGLQLYFFKEGKIGVPVCRES